MKYIEAKYSRKRQPTPPGELLARDFIPSLAISKSKIAALLGISRQSLYDILNCRQLVTPQMAVHMGKLFGNGVRLWLNMQTAHDLWLAEQTVDTSKIPTLDHA